MSDPPVNLVADVSVADVAREFVRSVRLPPDTAIESSSGDDPVPPAALTLVLQRARKPQRVDWWGRVAEAWLDAGQPAVARACVERARELLLAGSRVNWKVISGIAALSARIDGWTKPPRPSAPVQVNLASEAADLKQARVAATFRLRRRDNPASYRGPWRAEDVATLLVRGRTGLDSHFARAWYDLDEHHLLVEHLLVTVAARPMAAWLHRYGEELVWCGRSLLRLGDAANAWACFWLAAGMDTRRVISSQYVDVAREHLRRLGESEHPGSPDVPDRLDHPPGSRLGTWLLEHQIEGAFGGFEDTLRRCEARGVPGTLERQRRYLGQLSGWFLPTLKVPEPPRPQAWNVPGPAPRAPGVLARPPRPRARSGLHWSSPPPRERDGSAPASAEPAASAARPSSIPAGFLTSGTVATFDVAPGGGVMLLGHLATATAMRQIGEELAMEGWTVIHLAESGDDEDSGNAYRGWHRLTAAGRPGDDHGAWASELVAVPHVRQAVRDELVASLPECTDPAATACVTDLLEAAHTRPGWQSLLANRSLTASATAAAAVVDAAADLPFQRAGDLRRAALLLNHTVAAASTIGRALSIRWHEGAVPHAPVLIDTAGPRLEATIRLAVMLGSLVRALSAEPPAEEAPAAKAPTEPDTKSAGAETDMDLAVQLRPDPADVADLIAAVEAADRSDRPRRAPVADTEEGKDATSPWVSHGVVDQGKARRPLCVIVQGGLGDTWPVVAEWIATAEARSAALVLGAEAPDARALALAWRCDRYVVGRLPRAGQRLFEIAAGARLPHAMDDIDEHHGLIVEATSSGSRSSRFAVWPSRHPRTWSQ
ncbi:hypothetical protein [Dactylosporangium sp. CA-233914]|uniref:hypothetical protein n=1 Tax=Dactylosporangium sp. CA-233914 TaxID=3239934 RepID=UPI003D8E167F